MSLIFSHFIHIGCGTAVHSNSYASVCFRLILQMKTRHMVRKNRHQRHFYCIGQGILNFHNYERNCVHRMILWVIMFWILSTLRFCILVNFQILRATWQPCSTTWETHGKQYLGRISIINLPTVLKRGEAMKQALWGFSDLFDVSITVDCGPKYRLWLISIFTS